MTNLNSNSGFDEPSKKTRAEDIILPTLFYTVEAEKVKLNWFCYELALNLFDQINPDLGKKLKNYKIGPREIAGFSVYFAKEMKGIILQKLAGEIEHVHFNYQMVEAYFPKLDDRLVDKMLDAIAEIWDELLAGCAQCPTRCISEKDQYCTMFDWKEF